jgi:hypothetical protein
LSTDECGPSRACFPITSRLGACYGGAGTIPPGEVCTPNLGGLCEPFAFCDQRDPVPVCRALCDTTSDDRDAPCGADELCFAVLADEGITTGFCSDACDWNASRATDGCDVDTRALCVPIEEGRSICLDSGTTPVGQPCNLVEGEGIGICEAPALCLANDEHDRAPDAAGTCISLCRPFAAADGIDRGCPAGEVCSLWDQTIGFCGGDVAEPAIAPMDSCPVENQWCAENTLCIDIGQGDLRCIAICRLEGGVDDCGALPEGFVCTEFEPGAP